MSIEITKAQLKRLFNENEGLTGKELSQMFGTEEFVLILLDDAKHLQWLKKVMKDGKVQKPVRYWCSEDKETMARLGEIAEHYGITGMDDLLMESSASLISGSQ